MLNFLSLAISLCRQDLQERFAGSMLGSIWVFIWPLVQLFIYLAIFGKLMGARLGAGAQVQSYGIYVAAGLLSWTCFANTLQRAARIFVDKRHIIGKVNVDLRIFPLAVCLGELVPFIAGFALLFFADLAMGWEPSADLLAATFFALCCQQILAAGLGLFLACCAVFARDIVEATGIILQMGFWFTPIVYLPSILPTWLAKWLWINPMACAVDIFQKCFVFNVPPKIPQMLWLAFIACLALSFGLYALKRWQKDIRDVL